MLGAGTPGMGNSTLTDMTLLPGVEPVVAGLAAGSSSSSGQEGKARKKPMKSLYLKFFDTAPDGKSRICRLCRKSYCMTTATGNLGKHLNNRHPGYHQLPEGVSFTTQSTIEATMLNRNKKPHVPVRARAQAQPQDQVQVQAQSQVQDQAQPKVRSQPKTKEMIDVDHVNWLLLRWLISASLPPSTLEDNMLIDSCKYLSSSVRLWPKEKVQEIILEVFRSMKEDVKETLQCISSRLSVTLDFWTSYEKIVYMSIKCHWIDENWVSQKVLLDVCRIPYPSTGSKVFQVLMDVLVMYNIDSRILACTHNNSQRSIHACREFAQELESRKLPFCYIPCAARTLKAIIEAGLENVEPTLCKIREFILHINSNQEMMEDFKHWTEVYEEVSWKLPFDHSANWNNDYNMLDVVKKAPNAIENTIKKIEELLGPRDWVLTTAEKSVIDLLHSYLEPFFKTTTNLCNCKLPTLGLVFFFMDHVFELINLCHNSNNHQQWLKNIAGDMSKRAEKFTTEAYNIYTFTAAILDPRIKGELIPETLNSTSNLEDARNHFVRDYSSTFQAVGNGHGAQDTTEDAGAFSFAEEIIRKRRRVSMTTAADELSQYLAEPPAPISTDALEWWRGHSSRYPRLSLMARDFLAIQGTSLDPEELFTSKGDNIHKQQYCLPLSSMQAIMCIKSWMQSGYQFNFQSTIIDFDRLVESAAPPDDIGGSSLLHS